MHHIIYLSKVSAPLSEGTLVSLLKQARTNNQQRKITGFLLYSDRQFLQLIEGEQAEVTKLYAKLTQDPRHSGVIKLADKPITHRSFAEWSMAFHTVSPDQMAQLTGYLSLGQVSFAATSLSATDTALLHMAREFVCAAA
jgi:hypothetical protein